MCIPAAIFEYEEGDFVLTHHNDKTVCSYSMLPSVESYSSS